MAVARAPMRLRLCPRSLLTSSRTPFTPVRLATTVPGTRKNSGWVPTERPYVRHDDRVFVKPDGTLQTTPASAAFLAAHNIEHDNGVARRVMTPTLLHIARHASIGVRFARAHVLNPVHLYLFTPRDHPLAAQARDRYAARARDEPLWVWIVPRGVATPVVRTIVQRRIKYHVLAALQNIGYGPNGKGVDGRPDLRGTLLIDLFEPVEAAGQDASKFGRAVAEALLEKVINGKGGAADAGAALGRGGSKQGKSRGAGSSSKLKKGGERVVSDGEPSLGRGGKKKDKSSRSKSAPKLGRSENDAFDARFASRRPGIGR